MFTIFTQSDDSLYCLQSQHLMQLWDWKFTRFYILNLIMPVKFLWISSTNQLLFLLKRPYFRDYFILCNSLKRNLQKWTQEISILLIILLLFVLIGFDYGLLYWLFQSRQEDFFYFLQFSCLTYGSTSIFIKFYGLPIILSFIRSDFCILLIDFYASTFIFGLGKRKHYNYQGLILVFLSTVRHLFKNKREVELICLLQRTYQMDPDSIFFRSYFSFLARQGVSLNSNSQKIIPNAQISLLNEYQFFLRDYGAIQRGDPTLYLLLLERVSTLTANPKSAILIQLLCVMSIFAGFRSLCTMSFLYISRQPSMMEFIIWNASASFTPFFIILAKSEIHSSVMIQVLFLVVNISSRCRTLLHPFIYLSISIQEESSSRLIQFFSIFKSMTLTATFYSMLLAQVHVAS